MWKISTKKFTMRFKYVWLLSVLNVHSVCLYFVNLFDSHEMHFNHMSFEEKANYILHFPDRKEASDIQTMKTQQQKWTILRENKKAIKEEKRWKCLNCAKISHMLLNAQAFFLLFASMNRWMASISFHIVSIFSHSFECQQIRPFFVCLLFRLLLEACDLSNEFFILKLNTTWPFWLSFSTDSHTRAAYLKWRWGK